MNHRLPLPGGRIVAGFALLAVSVLGSGVAVASADDASDYAGTQCQPEQFFDASVQRCLPELVSNNPQGEPHPQDVGANYDGTRCDADLFYDGTLATCALEAVTNDPTMAETLESGNPMDSNLPVGGPG